MDSALARALKHGIHDKDQAVRNVASEAPHHFTKYRMSQRVSYKVSHYRSSRIAYGIESFVLLLS